MATRAAPAPARLLCLHNPSAWQSIPADQRGLCYQELLSLVALIRARSARERTGRYNLKVSALAGNQSQDDALRVDLPMVGG